MVVEHDIPNYFLWLPGNLLVFLLVACGVGFFGILVGYFISAIRHGLVEGFYVTAGVIADSVADVTRTSPARILTIARLTIKESFRRRVLVTFVVFAACMLFAGWFLDVKSEHPARLYLSFVLIATTYSVLVLAVLLSTASLPNDIKSRVMYTIVTKPVRSTEIVAGRILGFAAVGTMLLVGMCVASYVFVVTGVHHTHEIDAETTAYFNELKQRIQERQGQGLSDANVLEEELPRTTTNSFHAHRIRIDHDGNVYLDSVLDHTHRVEQRGEGDDRTYRVGPPIGSLQARLPHYGKLSFLDRAGRPTNKGLNVGNEWTYRTYLEGGSLAGAVWTFEGISGAKYPDGLPLEMTLSVFRTYKGDIEKGVLGTIVVRNPNPDSAAQSAPIPFAAEEYTVQRLLVPRRLQTTGRDGRLEDVDLFEKFVDNGRVEVIIQCADRNQYFGMAQADAYLSAGSGSFSWNFVKGYIGIWLQMFLVICFGVVMSTFLSHGVALLANFLILVIGFLRTFILDMALGMVQGGGFVESGIRLFTQQRAGVEFEENVASDVIYGFDWVVANMLGLAARLLPDFTTFDNSLYVASGYNISPHLLAAQATVALGFFLVLAVAGYFLLKTREIAA